MNYPQSDLQNAKGPKVKINTTLGEIEIQLFPEQAPKTVKNFVSLAQDHYYDGTIFHRVIPEFMVQGGDPTGTGMGGESIYGAPFEDEFSMDLFNIRGALSMANAGPNTNGSQFFIVQSTQVPADLIEQMKAANYPQEVIDMYQNGGTPWLDHRHTVFGQMIKGLDVVDQMAAAPTGAQDKPVDDIKIESIVVE
ncbi:peptidyl-prolyl cis-trans isomerase [Ligilactobacillus acidipiscis DSM 15836]|jgi:peptidyl-prolyl cis-trans isomerase B (cyclophilin B)|uniref:Peptidyl-prolyl cis-trans isomerase n=1 Tax=Ligilactobacillus acidipiscis DSM 15836 TaxID=1423716 RepID=A0ABR5PLD1_9LACO|nr:peptidylprolyl isomerase [Ligilactobacillus acidipiscis]KRM30252.1 peptidyl-prolyl cis-trans isomerase [Ligilactobacillus acidipiscis DSM 15836]MCI1925059.1 peptidylprolyl isomerase [Ligilactobacillus acidipiscis]MCI1954156.1 peptidylprolyl isomerase [Ligilactobacillus acidipiscis]GAW65220.1 peptidyl-prolyl cis-trans isomerase [Ligilactobacillus acidipiscis]GEN20673.1 peptidyl-prolyl cis-trans isomerase [Ligilactobacillus acidipiscis]